MEHPIRRVAVLGAGVMGSGIAAHIANAGLPVLLLDIVPPDLGGEEASDRRARDRFALKALARLKKAKPAPLYSAAHAEMIEVGNLEDDLERAGSCDLIIEAIVEKLEVKRALFERLEEVRKESTLVASNTSGLRISDMLEGRSGGFRSHFLVMHFFNPPRYMKLLELVAGPMTEPATLERAQHFGSEVLGKGIVLAKDSPNFVANRIGAHSMMLTIHEMLERSLAPEDVDAITGLPMAHPKSAIFRTADVVGIDTMSHVVENCYEALEQDEDREVFRVPDYIRAMLEKGRLGQKSGAGFYRKGASGIETLDPETGEYRPRGGDPDVRKKAKSLAEIEDPRERVRKLVQTDGVVGEFAWSVLSRSLAYAARRIGEITDQVAAIDDAMRWGYNWELGPFETWDALGFAPAFDRMKEDGLELPKALAKMRADGVGGFYDSGFRVYDPLESAWRERETDPREVKLEVLRRGDGPVLENRGAQAWDLGDGVLGVTFETKANSIDPDVIKMLTDAAERAERDFRALLVTNHGEHFCVGANLFLVAMAAGQKDWDQIRNLVGDFQKANQRLKYASVPVVAAPFGMTVGGGLEVCLAADAVQAAAETYAGLVEVGVGLIPGGGGCLNLLWRALEGVPDGVELDVDPFVVQVFKNIATARVATSAAEAKEYGYLRRSDRVSLDRARQLWQAKRLAISLAETDYHRPLPRRRRLPGESGIATLRVLIDTMVAGGHATEHDGLIAAKLARVLCGGAGGAAREVTEDDLLELEREAFVSLCGEAKSQERIQHMLMKNKPLRN